MPRNVKTGSPDAGGIIVKPIRIGLVGAGVIAQSQHIPALRENPAFRLEACASRSGRIEGIDNFSSLESMLDAHSTLGILTTLSARRRSPIMISRARPCCAANTCFWKSRLVPPPLSWIIRRTREGMTVLLLQSWHSRYAPAVNTARARLESEAVRAIRIVWEEDVRQWHPGQEWIWQSGGFGVFDPGIMPFRY